MNFNDANKRMREIKNVNLRGKCYENELKVSIVIYNETERNAEKENQFTFFTLRELEFTSKFENYT